MKLAQVIQKDVDLATLLASTDSVAEVIDYCQAKGYGVTLEDIRESFNIPSTAASEEYMEYAHAAILEAYEKAETMDPDEQLASVTGGGTAKTVVAAGLVHLGIKVGKLVVKKTKEKIKDRRDGND